MLTKDLLRVSRAGGGYRPKFVGDDRRRLAAQVLETFRSHADAPRAELRSAIDEIERDADDFKLVRGFAALLERDATFETRAAVPPVRARRVAFEAAEAVGVVTESERAEALECAADRLAVDVSALEGALYADRDSRQVMVDFDPRWDPDALLVQYNLSLAQTALFDATEVRVRSSDPRGLVTAVKRLRLMYEIERTSDGSSGDPSTGERTVVITGPDALFRRTRRYGTAFARLLRSVAAAPEWTLTATIDDRGTEREMTLTGDDVSVPGVDPIAEPTYDSGVEADFAARFAALDLDWSLQREPEPLAAGDRVMIPDFAFDYDPPGESVLAFRLFFEIMGFWTPEYVEKKLAQLEDVEDVELLVAVDESLGVGEEIAARDHRVITYAGSVRVKDVVDVLSEYERDLVAEAGASLPDELRPEADVVSLADLAASHGVSAEALEDRTFPEHDRIGRTLVRPRVLSAVDAELESGLDLDAARSILAERGIEDDSAALSALGYRVEWEGLGGGTLRRK